jgi:GAF domain-containing protein
VVSLCAVVGECHGPGAPAPEQGVRVVAVPVNGPTPALTELAGLLMSTTSFEGLLQAVTDLAGRAVPAASTCGITLSENGHVMTVASADAMARLLDEQQYELDAGPCLEALRTARVIIADDLISENRWDGYPALAVGHGSTRTRSVR